ncbi:MAG: restriction endonuclease [Candidatus Paceibacterota bacterium]
MKKDIFEQITEDYFRKLGYFTVGNERYKPAGVGVNSDIDVLAMHPLSNDLVVVSCKGWQSGINIREILETLKTNPDKIIRGGTFRKRLREIADEDSAKELKKKVYSLTGKDSFTFYLSVVDYKGNKDDFENFYLFKKNLPNCDIKIITFRNMIEFLDLNKTTTPSHSDIIHILQLLKAAKGEIIFKEIIQP